MIYLFLLSRISFLQDIDRCKVLNGGYVYMKNNILMFSIFGVVIIYMCMSGIKVYAAEETNSITDGSYTVTIPREVQIPSGSDSQSFEVKCDKIYKDDVVNVTVDKKNGSMKSKGGTASIPYAISFGDNTQNSDNMTFTPDKTTNSISVNLQGNGNVAGTYSDTLTFNISSIKQQYNLNIRGYLEGNLMQNIGEIANVTVNGINDTESNGLQYNNVVSTTKYNIQVAIKDPSKYVLSEVKNNVKSDASTGFEWNEVNNTITGTVAGDYASADGTVYLDLYFVPKKYKLTFDANDGQFSNGTTKKTFEVAYDKPLEKIGTDVLNLAKNDPYYFGGWYTTKIEEGYPKKSSDKMPNEDLTLYAGWSKGVKVGLNGLLEGETVLRDTLAGLGKADFIITKDDSKSEKSVIDIDKIFESTDEYTLNITPNYGYQYVELSTEQFNHAAASITGTSNLTGRLYDQPISLVKGTRYVSFNVKFKPITYDITFTKDEGVKDSFKIENDQYTYGRQMRLPSITSNNIKDGYQFVCWSVTIGNNTFKFNSGEDINNNQSFKQSVAENYKNNTGNITFNAICSSTSNSTVSNDGMNDDSINDLSQYSDINNENSVNFQSNLNTISQPELGTEENKESEENTDGE